MLIFALLLADGQSILSAAAKACAQVRTIQYSVQADFQGTPVNADIVVKRANVTDTGFSSGMYVVQGTIQRSSRTKEPFKFAYDGKALRVLGTDGKIRQLDKPEAYQVASQLPPEATTIAFPLVNDFFDQMLKGKVQTTSKGTLKVGAWQCDVLDISREVHSESLGDIVTTAEWAFDQKTHLPVKVTTALGIKTITAMTLNPSVDDAVFALKGAPVLTANPLGAMTDKLLPLGALAPQFTLRDPQGKARSLKDYRGRVVLLDFWGTWCVPCRQAMPKLQKLYAQYRKRGFVVVGIAVADNAGNPAAYMKRNGFTYDLLLSGDQVARAYKATLLPTTYLIDRNGRIVRRQAGVSREMESELSAAIEKSLG